MVSLLQALFLSATGLVTSRSHIKPWHPLSPFPSATLTSVSSQPTSPLEEQTSHILSPCNSSTYLSLGTPHGKCVRNPRIPVLFLNLYFREITPICCIVARVCCCLVCLLWRGKKKAFLIQLNSLEGGQQTEKLFFWVIFPSLAFGMGFQNSEVGRKHCLIKTWVFLIH